MCGICGIFSFNDPVDSGRLEAMMEAIRHRGPDSKGLHVENQAGIGVRRLSIIDLKTGDQPIHNEDSSVWMVFNGEIYNYQDLRAKCIEDGHQFYTQSDTETVVHLYEKLGPEVLRHLDGMFAICIWDKPQNRLLLARDRVGEKPLYWVQTPNELIFGSEPKAILAHPSYSPEVDELSLERYLVLGYVPSPCSIYKGMSKLAPGEFMIVNGDGAVSRSSYFAFEFQPSEERSNEDMVNEVTETIRSAVKSREVSDVPIGVLLSGGVDSSLVASFMRETMNPEEVNAFTIGFTNSTYDESSYALKVAHHLGISTEVRTFTEAEVLEYVNEVLSVLDEPIADPSLIPTYLVSRVASEKVKVVLTGDGGDEMFGGYPKYRAHLWLGIYDSSPAPIKWLISKAIRGLPRKIVGEKGKRVGLTLANSVAERNMLWVSPFLPSELPAILTRKPSFSHRDLEWSKTQRHGATPANVAMQNDIRYALGDLFLSKVDRTSMACSLESRAPFLAANVLNLASALPSRTKVGFLRTKILLKELALARLPRETVLRQKRGFGIPLSAWLKGPLKGFVLSTLSKERLESTHLLSYPEVERLLEDHFSGAMDNSAKIWTVVVFQVWYEKWIGAKMKTDRRPTSA